MRERNLKPLRNSYMQTITAACEMDKLHLAASLLPLFIIWQRTLPWQMVALGNAGDVETMRDVLGKNMATNMNMAPGVCNACLRVCVEQSRPDVAIEIKNLMNTHKVIPSDATYELLTNALYNSDTIEPQQKETALFQLYREAQNDGLWHHWSQFNPRELSLKNHIGAVAAMGVRNALNDLLLTYGRTYEHNHVEDLKMFIPDLRSVYYVTKLLLTQMHPSLDIIPHPKYKNEFIIPKESLKAWLQSRSTPELVGDN